jgi:hypothetical protein
LACHFPNSGHTTKTMKVVTVDWFREFNRIPDQGFVQVVDEALRVIHYFPVIADLWDAAKKTGLCDRCKYRNFCSAQKKYEKDYGKTCDSCVQGRAEK